MKLFIQLLAALLASTSQAQIKLIDWQTAYRSTVAIDYLQTENHIKKPGSGFVELNPNLRGSRTDTFLKMTGDALLVPWLIERLPKGWRDFAGWIAVVIRALPVMNNNRIGITPRGVFEPISIKIIQFLFNT